MTTLDNGIVVEEHINAVNYTPLAQVPNVFGYDGTKTGITIHHWGPEGQKFDDVVNYLASANGRTNSAHFILQEDRVSCIVNSFDSSWHSGDAYGNAKTIGIECRPEMTEGDLDTLASLVRYLETCYGSLEVYIHKNFQNTACPGKYEGRVEEIINEINGVVIAPNPPVVAPDAPKHDCCCHD